jgi:hypothetical protein
MQISLIYFSKVWLSLKGKDYLAKYLSSQKKILALPKNTIKTLSIKRKIPTKTIQN